MRLPESILGRTWSTRSGDVTGEDVQRVFDTIARGEQPPARSSRRTDRALQVLRKAGFIEHVTKSSAGYNGWRLVEKSKETP